MIFHNFKIALRQILRNKAFTFINIIGLSIGMACSILILLWVQDELSFEDFHKNANNIYRVAKEYQIGGKKDYNPSTPYPLVSVAKDQIPGIENYVRYRNRSGVLKYKDISFTENRICATDSTFFNIFSYHFISGNPQKAFSNPNSIIITQNLAQKYFGDEDPMGKIISYNKNRQFIVNGLVEDTPDNSDIIYNCFLPLSSFVTANSINDWSSHFYYSYILINKNADYISLENKLSALLQENSPDQTIAVKLQSLTKMHLYDINGEKAGMKQVVFFTIIAFFIIVIACINYMNLSTARSTKRSREVGIRKLIGVSQKKLIGQFYSESFIYSIFAIIIAFIIVEISRPGFNNLTEKNLIINYFDFKLIVSVTLILLLTTILSGTYPAIILSSFKPNRVLRGSTVVGLKGISIRRILIIIQFFLSIVLMTCTGIIYSQLKYIDNRDMGFNSDNLLILSLNDDINDNYEAFKEELLSNPELTGITRTSEVPSSIYFIQRGISWEGKETEEGAAFGFAAVDPDYFDVMQIELLEGRSFSDEFASDSSAIMFNETAIKIMGLNEPTGKRFSLSNSINGNIIGVVKDFNALPLSYEIEPMLFIYYPNYFFVALIKMNGNNISDGIDFIKNTWEKYAPDFSFEPMFLKDSIKTEYGDKEKSAKIFGYFVILAIFITCLGLYGLASFIAEQKTKEIGIRKVLGASVSSIAGLFSREFLVWVIISFVLAIPVAIYIMDKWLQSFAYKTKMHWWIFLLAGFIAILIASITVSTQAIRAALKNPVDSIRHE